MLRRADAWPPFYTKGEPQAGKGVQDLLGTTDHEGKDLVTYDGHPLYYYVNEGPNEAARASRSSAACGSWSLQAAVIQ